MYMHVHCNIIQPATPSNIKLARMFSAAINDSFAIFLVTFEPLDYMQEIEFLHSAKKNIL